jgi:hypothetical protein
MIRHQFSTLESLKEFCKENISKIATRSLRNVPKITIRYIDPYGDFGYAELGDFFFYGSTLYIITTDIFPMDELNISFFNEDFLFPCVLDYLKQGKKVTFSYYFFPAIFAGIFTVFLDESGERIFTGDVVQFSENQHHRAGVSEVWNEFSVILDNHHLPLSQARKLYLLGSLFYDLDIDTEYGYSRPVQVDIRRLCNMYCPSYGRTKQEEERINKLIKESPSFKK